MKNNYHMALDNKSFIFLDEVDSTNNYVLQNFDTLSSFCMVTAKKQTAGKGRRGNKWISSGENFYGTMLIKNPEISPGATGWIAALATLNTLRQYAPGSDLWIKWPNDIYCRDKKISGVLCEVKNDSSNKPLAIAIGIGVNLNMDEHETASIASPATSLYLETASKIKPEDFAVSIAESIERLYRDALASGEKKIFELWKTENRLIGREIEVLNDKKELLKGVASDIKDSGELVFKPHSGSEIMLNSGDISVKSASGIFSKK